MPIVIFRAVKHPAADINAFGDAAYQFCRSARSVDGLSGRFYWTGMDTVGFVFEASGAEPLQRLVNLTSEPPIPALEAARFRLAEQGVICAPELWMDPARGMALRQAAER